MRSIFPLFVLICLITSPGFSQLKTAIIQYSIQEADAVGADADRFEEFVREAAASGARLVVGPETLFYRYEPWRQGGSTMLDLANEYDDLARRFSGLSREIGIYLVIGLREPSGDPDKPVYNTALFFGRHGEILGRHRKLNPSNAEKAFTKAGTMENGDGIPFLTPIGRVGMLVCKDMDNGLGCNNCPAWDLELARLKPELFIGVNGDASRGWIKVVRGCREAGCYGIGANLAQNTWDERTGGNSGFVNPYGYVINEAGPGEKIIYQDLPMTEKIPMDGQIIRDPFVPSGMVFNRDEDGDGNLDQYYLSGPGGPEGFLYMGPRNEDGTRKGELQKEMIEKLQREGGNAIYLMAVRTHGGDAWKDTSKAPERYPDALHNPWIGQDPRQGLNEAILDQWEEWFRLMDRNEIQIFFIFYDDAIKLGDRFGWQLDDHGELQPEEKSFITSLVNRFEHHRNLVWCVMEEAQEMGGDWKRHTTKIAEAIYEADDYGHIIASHQHGGNVFYHEGDPYISQFAVQTHQDHVRSVEDLHQFMLEAWKHSRNQYILNMAEDYVHGNISCPNGDREEIRKRNWAAAMAGSHVMVFGMDILNTPASWLNDCRTMQAFFESTPFNLMAPADTMSSEETEYVLTDRGYDYILYGSSAKKKLGIMQLNVGTYRLQWLDCASGRERVVPSSDINRDQGTFRIPDGFGKEVALFIKRLDERPALSYEPKTSRLPGRAQANTIPEVSDMEIRTPVNQQLYIQLIYHDDDGGPGPYDIKITTAPEHGRLSGEGNDRYYTPARDFRGQDVFQWRVHDGAGFSRNATVHIFVE